MITIIPNVLGPATTGEFFSATLTGAGGTGPYTFAVVAGVLPAGFTLDIATGIISGTGAAASNSNFTARATDSLAAFGDQPYDFRIKPPIYWYICTRSAETPLLPTIAADQREHNRKVANALESLGKSRHKVGDVKPRPTLQSIPDHLLCDGSAVSRASFPQLFAEIGTEWGAGDGSTTFNIPDLVGGAIPVALTAPPQVITSGGTVSTGETITSPSTPAQVGGTTGGNISIGGRNEYENIP